MVDVDAKDITLNFELYKLFKKHQFSSVMMASLYSSVDPHASVSQSQNLQVAAAPRRPLCRVQE